MPNLDISVRLRPVRFAFLTKPDDAAKALEIFRANSSLWGGQFNPIIPVFERVPSWWERHHPSFQTAAQIVSGYLEWFTPDFVVEARKGLADKLGFDNWRVLQLADVVPVPTQSGRRLEGYGLSVLDCYSDLYQKHFQYERRHKIPVISMEAREPRWRLFNACVFGDFPRQAKYRFLSRAFQDAFDPERVVLTPEAYIRCKRKRQKSILDMGKEGLDVRYRDIHDPALFILNASEPRDLIDYWNLRAIRGNVTPIPMQWLASTSEYCRELIRRSHRPLPGNPHGVMIHMTCMFARSIPKEQIQPLFDEFLAVDLVGANVLQDWYPSMWRPSPSFTMRALPPEINAGEASHDSVIKEDGSVTFSSLSPSFAQRFGDEYRWANVVKLREWGGGQRATTYPTAVRQALKGRLRLGAEQPISTTEGLIVFPSHEKSNEHWQVLEGAPVIARWLTDLGFTTETSESGRAAEQIMRTLDGGWGVRHIANRGIVELLDEMARGTRTLHADAFQQRIKRANTGSIWEGGEYEYLVKRRAVELGMDLRCPKCETWSWYSIKQLDYKVVCELCLGDFEFPKTDRKRSRYSYRVIGPFALRDYAIGGYAGALAIRFFSEVLTQTDNAGVTWAAGQKLTLPKDGGEVEVDFVLWYQQKQLFGADFPTEIVFGEAKSYGRYLKGHRRDDVFKSTDLERMQDLAERFPGAILVFATLKEASEFSKAELRRLRLLAEWGRQYEREHLRTRAPVIVLTGTELFTPYHLRDVWGSKGARHRAFIDAHCDTTDLRRLADMTQQLYLGMPSYSEWSHAKLERRRARLKKLAAKDIVPPDTTPEMPPS